MRLCESCSGNSCQRIGSLVCHRAARFGLLAALSVWPMIHAVEALRLL
jgi:hypothetical protein